VRNADRVEPSTDFLDGGVDGRVGRISRDVDGPAGEDVSDPVELRDHAEELDDLGVFPVAREAVVVERLPHRRSVSLEHLCVLPEGPLGAPDEVEKVVHALRLRLRVAHERGAQAPVLGARTFGEVDESGEGGRFELGGHVVQRTKPSAATVLNL
jgi:hypothetical protein